MDCQEAYACSMLFCNLNYSTRTWYNPRIYVSMVMEYKFLIWISSFIKLFLPKSFLNSCHNIINLMMKCFDLKTISLKKFQHYFIWQVTIRIFICLKFRRMILHKIKPSLEGDIIYIIIIIMAYKKKIE